MVTNLIDSIETEKRPATQGADYEAPAQVIVRDLIKRYGDLTAVAGVSFEVRSGEVFGLLGPNGAGKTTTVEIIEGLRPRDGGEVTVCGFDPAEDVKEVKKRIGVALQATALPDKIEVREALALFAGLYPMGRRSRADIDRLLRTVSLEEKAKSRFDTLSGGQRQRLAVALALVNEPEVVIMDEPTTGLDAQARRELHDVVARAVAHRASHGQTGRIGRIAIDPLRRKRNGIGRGIRAAQSRRAPRPGRIGQVDGGGAPRASRPARNPAHARRHLHRTYRKKDTRMNMLNAWVNNTLIGLKLTFRDRQAIFWTYAFPIFFLFLYASIFARGRAGALLAMLPGLLCISAMSGGLWGVGVALSAMRERGVLRRYHLAPISPWMIITSGIASNLLVSLSTLLMQIALAKIVYKIEIAGGAIATFIMLVVGALAFFSLGFVVASVADNVKSAVVLCNLLFFPLMFLGGAAFPMELLPPKLQDLARVLPSNYMVDGLYRIMKEGEGLVANLKNLAVLLLCCAVSLFVAAKLFRWEADEKLPLKRKAWAAAVVVIFVGAALFVKR